MTDRRLAIIDMGTNTFHLLVVDMHRHDWTELHRERVFVNLAEDGIEKISSNAWERAMKAVQSFDRHIRKENIRHIRAVGTSALRNAENAPAFVKKVKEEFGITVNVIDGLQEASYICQGAVAAAQPSGPALIMDIGGGSVEFCIHTNGQSVFNGSYQVGVAVLYDMFHHSEPISQEDIDAIHAHLDSELAEVFERCAKYPGVQLIGASGSFEVLDRALLRQLAVRPFTTYPVADFKEFYSEIVSLDVDGRMAHPDVPAERVLYIVCALYLIHYVVEQLEIDTIGLSAYAMKEGIAVEFAKYLD